MEREEEAALWQASLAGRDAVLRGRLIERYLPEVHRIAAHAYARRGPQAPEFDDYLQWARLGPIAAFDRHGPAREEERRDSRVEGADEAEALERLADVTLGLALGFALEDSGLGAAPEGFDPYRVLELKRLRERLLLIVEALPERERRILKWHYFEQMEFKLVGAALGLSKGRISQLHSRGLKLMREGLRSIERFDISF